MVTTSLGAASRPLPPLRWSITDSSRAARDAVEAACPEGMLPDGDACVHIPATDEAEDSVVSTNAHRERSGRWALYDQIPRRPDRPADYELYRYPAPAALPGGRTVVSGYDLDRPNESQRRGMSLRAVGHGGVDIPGPRGTEIKLVALEHQQGDATIVHVGPLFGTSVVTRHTIREAGQLRDYLLLYGHLASAAPGLAVGATAREGDLLGFMGDTGSPELVHLHLEVRRMREGVDVSSKIGAQLMESSVSIVCDPRNVLPLK
ncbi:M23 family metallopeptidase [Pendulispora albinea]|uniref:M23 family metallopeptidase n=1 Tax=Pendulispora albinea TaxID=2741071 RepID=A0ABZ2M9E5_9BACT